MGHVRRASTFLAAAQMHFEQTGYQQFRPLPALAMGELQLVMAFNARCRENRAQIVHCAREAARIAREIRAAADKGELALYEIDAALIEARSLLLEGGVSRARSLIERLLERIRSTGYAIRLPDALLVSAECELQRGNLRKTRRVLESAKDSVRRRGLRRLRRRLRSAESLIDGQ